MRGSIPFAVLCAVYNIQQYVVTLRSLRTIHKAMSISKTENQPTFQSIILSALISRYLLCLLTSKRETIAFR